MLPRSLRRRPVHLHIVERRKGRDHCQAEGLLARDEIVAQHAPGALAIADAYGTRVAIDGDGKLGAAGQDFFREKLRDFDAAGAAEMPARAVGDIRPAFEKYMADTIFGGDIKAAFKANAEISGFAGISEQFVQRLCALTGALHEFFAGRWRMADAAFDFVALDFERCVRRELGDKAGGSFLNRLEFRPPGAPDGDAACAHGDRGPVSAVYWEMRGRLEANLDGLRKRGGKPAFA